MRPLRAKLRYDTTVLRGTRTHSIYTQTHTRTYGHTDQSAKFQDPDAVNSEADIGFFFLKGLHALAWLLGIEAGRR